MATIFLNARWTEEDSGPASITWGNQAYSTTWISQESDFSTYSADAAYRAYDVQAAINFAHAGDTIVFYDYGISSNSHEEDDFRFYDQHAIIIDKDLNFRTGSRTQDTRNYFIYKAVKFDSLQILKGVTVNFGRGLYSTDDILDNKGTIELINSADINANLVQNDEDGVILVDTSSRLAASSIEDGTIVIRAGFDKNEKTKWVDRPFMARIANGVEVKLVSPNGSGGEVTTTLGTQGTGSYEMVHLAKKKSGSTSSGKALYCYAGDEVPAYWTTYVNSTDYDIYNYYVVSDNESLILTSDVFDLKSNGDSTYTTAALYVVPDWTSGTFTAKRQDTADPNTTVSVSPQYDGTTIVSTTVVGALNGQYVQTHAFDQNDQGVIIRVKGNDADSADYLLYDESSATINSITRDIIVEPDKYLDSTGKWVYDKVGIKLQSIGANSPNLMSFAHLDYLSIHDWVFGAADKRTGVLNFSNIKRFEINYRLKTQGGSTTRIVNCDNVISNRHLSVAGGTLIIENSNVTLKSGTGDGVLSTQNNWLGSGSVIVRNSTFVVEGADNQNHSVNLKLDAEFIITGRSTVNAVFTDIAGKSDTRITFRDAVLGSNSSIRSLASSLPSRGADLHFEGNNSFDGVYISQAGGRDMLVEPGSTVDLANGTTISLPNYNDEISVITNNGLINLSEGSLISGGTISNAPESSMTVDGTSTIQTDLFENSEGAILTLALNPDGSIPIRPISTDKQDPDILNSGTVILDASGLDYTPNHIPLDAIGGDGEILLKVSGAGIEIITNDPVTGEPLEHPYILMSQPDTTTLYINRQWGPDGTHCTIGQNVGLFTYYGYNAFSDNGNPDNANDPMWKEITSGTTKRLIYTGVDSSASYEDLDLSLATAENGITIRTVERDSATVTANFGTLSAGASTPVMLSGATANIAVVSVQNNGTISVTPGESAKLLLNVANEESARDVQIDVVNEGTHEKETFSVRVPAGETIVELSSSKFIVGQSYYVAVTDKNVLTAKYEDSNRKLTINVAFVPDVSRYVNVTVRGAESKNKDAIYSFRNCPVAANTDRIKLHPDFSDGFLVSVKDKTTGADYAGTYDKTTGKLTLDQDSEGPHTLVAVVSNGTDTLTYTFELEAGTEEVTVDLPTQFLENSDYYVMVEEPQTTSMAVTDTLDRSDVHADSVVNNGTLNVISENGTKCIGLTGFNTDTDCAAKVTVAELNKTYTVLIPRGTGPSDTICLYSDDFTAGTTYTATIVINGEQMGDPQTTTAEDVRRKAAMITVVDDRLLDPEVAHKVKMTIGDRTYTAFVAKGSNTAKFASVDFEVGKTYSSVTITDGETTFTGSYTAETLSRFSAGSVTNNSGIVIKDADFTADTLVNRKDKTVDADNASIQVASALTNAGSFTASGSTVAAGSLGNTGTITMSDTTVAAESITNSGTITASGSAITVGTSVSAGSLANTGTIALNTLAGDDPVLSSLTVYGDVTNSGSLSYVFVNAAGTDDEVAAAQKFQVVGGSVNNAGGTITIDASAFTGTSKQVTDFAVTGGIVTATGKDNVIAIRDSATHYVYLINSDVNTETLYVNNMAGWTESPPGLAVNWDGFMTDLSGGINAFTSADSASEGLAADTGTIVFKGANSASYGNLDLSAIAQDITVTSHDDAAVGIGTLTAAGTNTVTLSGIELTATESTNSGNISISAGGMLDGGTVTNSGNISYAFVDDLPSAQAFQAASVDNTGGTITIDVSAADFTVDKQIQVTSFAVNGGMISITGNAQGLSAGETVTAIRKDGNKVWLIATPADTTTLYVSNTDGWAGDPGTKITSGWNPDSKELYFGVNAFANAADTVTGITSATAAIMVKGGNSTNYGSFDLSGTITDGLLTITTDSGTASITDLTTTAEQHLTLDNANLNATGAVTNNGALLQSGGVLTADTFTNVESATFTQSAGAVSATSLANSAEAEMLVFDTVSAGTLANSGLFTQSAGAVSAGTLTNAAEAEMVAFGAVSAGTLTNSGIFAQSAGTVSATSFANITGATFTQSAGTVNATSLENTGRIMQASGTVNVTGDSGLVNSSGGVMTLKDTVSVTKALTNSGTINQATGSMTASSFANDASGKVTFGGSASISKALTNAGSINQTAGSVGADSFTNTGSFTQYYGQMNVTNTITNSSDGVITMKDSVIVESSGGSATNVQTGGTVTATSIVNNGAIVQSAGSMTASTLANNGTGSITQSAGTIEITATGAAFTMSKTTVVVTTVTSGTGGITNSAGGVMVLGGTVDVAGGVIANYGSFTQSGGLLKAKVIEHRISGSASAMELNGSVSAGLLWNRLGGGVVKLDLIGEENTIESIRNEKSATLQILGGTLTVTDPNGISNPGDLKLGISASESSNAVLNVKKLDMINWSDDQGRGALFVYKNAVINIGTETDGEWDGILTVNSGNAARKIEIRGGTVNAGSVVNNGQFSVYGESVVNVSGDFSGTGGITFSGATLDERSKITQASGTTKNLSIVTSTVNVMDGAIITVNDIILEGMLTLSNKSGNADCAYTVTGSIANRKRLTVKDGATLSVAGDITAEATSSTAPASGKAIDVFVGSTLTCDGTITNGIINVGTIDDNGESLLSDDFYILVRGTLSSDTTPTLTVDKNTNKETGKTIGPDGSIEGTDYKITTLNNKGVFLTKADPTMLYVNEAWNTATDGDLVTCTIGGVEYTYLYGYNAFSSFIGALTVAKDNVSDTTVKVLSDVTETNLENSVFGAVSFQNNLLIDYWGDSTGATVDLQFKTGDDNPGDVDFYFSPASNKTITVGSGIAITESNADTNENQGLWLNCGGTGSEDIVRGTLGKVWNLKVGGKTTVANTGMLIAHTFIIQNDSPLPADPEEEIPAFTITGTEGSFTTGNRQVQGDASGTMYFASGKAVTTDTFISVGNIDFSNARYGYAPTAPTVLVSTNTDWDVRGNMYARFFADEENGDTYNNIMAQTGTFTFNGGRLGIAGSLDNVPRGTTGQEVLDVIAGAHAMTITLKAAAMTVGGSMENAGTITLNTSYEATSGTVTGDVSANVTGAVTNTATGEITLTASGTDKAVFTADGLITNEAGGSIAITGSTLTANAGITNEAGGSIAISGSTLTAATSRVTNSGTFDVSGASTLEIGTLDGTITLLNGEISDSTISAVDSTNGGTLNVSSGNSVTFSGTNDFAAAITNSGTIIVNNTLNSGAIDNAGGTITVNGTLSATGTIDNAGGAITINNITNSTTAPAITATSITNVTADSITIDATGFTSGTLKVIDFTSNTDLNIADINLTHAAAGVRLVKASDGDIYITKQDQTTLYVNGNYTEGSCDGHLYGFNAFNTLASFTYHGTGANRSTQYPETTTIEFTTASSTYGFDQFLQYFTDNDVTLKGTATNSSVYVNSGRLYLMTAVPGAPGEYADNVASTTPKTFTIDNGLSLTVSSMLKVGDVVDSGDNRTGGVANLVVKDGSVNNYVTVSPYSSVVVLKDGALRYTPTSATLTNSTYIRPHGVLTVHGTAENVTDAASTTTTAASSVSTVQYKMDRTAFADGGTLNIYSAHAQMNHIRLYDVSGRTIDATGATVNFDHAYVESYNGVSGNFFEWDSTTVQEAITVNVTASTWDLGSLALNPNANVTIDVNASTVSAASVANGGTFNVSGASTLTVTGSLSGNAIELLDGTVIKDSTITSGNGTLNVASGNSVTFSGTNTMSTTAISNSGSISAKGATLSAGAISNTAAANTITINAASAISATSISSGTIDLNTENVSSVRVGPGNALVSGTLNDVTLTVTDSGTSTTTQVDSFAEITINGANYILQKTDTSIYLTQTPQDILYVKSSYTEGSCDDHIYGYNAFSSFLDALDVAATRSADTEIRILSSIDEGDQTDDLYYNPRVDFKGNITVTCGIPDGSAEIRMRFVADGRYDLLLSPKSGKSFTVAENVSFFLDSYGAFEHTSEPYVTYARSGIHFDYWDADGTTLVNSRIETTDTVLIHGASTVSSTGQLVSPHIIFHAGNKTVSIDGDGKFGPVMENEEPTGVTNYQLDGNDHVIKTPQDETLTTIHGALEFLSGTLVTTDTFIKGRYMTVTDDGYYDLSGKTFTLNSSNTTWDIEKNLKCEFYAGTTGTYSSELNFTNGSKLNIGEDAWIGGNENQAAQQGHIGKPMTISLTASDMTVMGKMENAGTITLAAGTKGTESNVESTLTVKGTASNSTGTLVLDNGVIDAVGTTYGITITNSQFDVDGAFSNTGAIMLDASSLITAASFSNESAGGPRGKIVIDASDYYAAVEKKDQLGLVIRLTETEPETPGTVEPTGTTTTYVKVIDVDGNTGTTLSVDDVLLTGALPGVCLLQLEDGDICVGRVDQSMLYVNSTWSDYKTGEQISEGEFSGYNAFSGVEKAIETAKSNTDPTIVPEIIIENLGTQSGTAYVYDSTQPVIQLSDVKTTIASSETTYQKAIYGGSKAEPGTTVRDVERNTDVTISGGEFGKFFVGGNNINMSTSTTEYTVSASTGGKQTVEISGGVFNAIVATGDRVQKGEFTLNSDLEMTIKGGTFNYIVAGGLLNSLYDGSQGNNGSAEIIGDVSLTIEGGSFTEGSWIYGGCVSTNKATGSAASAIIGNTTVTIDCGSGNAITLCYLAGGSHGWGEIKANEEKEATAPGSTGNTAVVFKGNGTNLSFTASGELWGGSGGDNVNPNTGKCEGEGACLVDGERLLSFEGFTGSLNCRKIRDFSSISMTGSSKVTLTESSVNLRGLENWTIQKGSDLTGSFANDFAGDTLNLTGFTDMQTGISNAIALLTDSNNEDKKNVFAGFDSLGVKLEGVSSTGWDSDNACWYWGTSDAHTFELYLRDNEDTTTSMVLAKV